MIAVLRAFLSHDSPLTQPWFAPPDPDLSQDLRRTDIFEYQHNRGLCRLSLGWDTTRQPEVNRC